MPSCCTILDAHRRITSRQGGGQGSPCATLTASLIQCTTASSGGEAAQGALLDLNADIGDAGILRRGELSFGSRGDPAASPSGEGDVLSVDDRPARSRQDTVDLLVSPVGMYKGHPRPSGEPG